MFNSKCNFGIRPLLFDLSNVEPLNHAFAHNDSVYNTPLFDALQLGFCYIEADVHLINNEIMVYHKRPLFINKNKTLTKCYLQPLFEIWKKENSIFPKYDKPVCLVLDIKTDAEKTYQKIKSVLQPFHSMLIFWENEIEHPNAIKIILSGNRPLEMVLSEKKRWVALDGRFEDIGKNYSPLFMPMISDKYSKIFGFSFFQKNPSAEQLIQHQKIAQSIHLEGKQMRLWGIPERNEVWNLLLENGLNLISTNKVTRLSKAVTVFD